MPSRNKEIPATYDLNAKQKEAVLSKEKRLLILAGAGSGKTKTIIQKILYLISEKNLDPSNILAITFTKNAANEMLDRLILLTDNEGKYSSIMNDKKLPYEIKEEVRMNYIKKYPWLSNITVKTFHSFCYYILRKHGTLEFDNKFRIISNKSYDDELDTRLKAAENTSQIIHKLVKQLSEDTSFLLKLKRYILDYYVDEHRITLSSRGYQEYQKPYTCLDGTNVRSKSERYIADWLFIHKIKFVYEPQITIKDFPFRPDFYIPEADLYLEHISNLSSHVKEKEEQFKYADKLLVQTYESMTKDISFFYGVLERNIFPRLDKNIKKDVALSVESEFKEYYRQLDEFISMIIAVIDKIKVENSNIEDIFTKASKDPHERVKIFYELAKPLIEEYKQYCISKSYLDFNDLIILTIRLFKNNEIIKKEYQKKFKHILVDEFQDVNSLQVKLLNQLLDKENQLFCVGDDWQSIYGWRGAEVDYIVNFTKYFSNTKIIKLNINYRSNDTIVKASNEVIKYNKFKLDKEITSINKEGRKIYLYCAQREEEDGVKIVHEKIKQLHENGYSKEDILILSRRNKSKEPYFSILRGLATFRTIHSAKGLEAKIVFIIGLTGGIYGFPQVWESDRIIQIIKESKFELLMEEERRLFYVAITRAKEELFLITEIGNESQFIKEIPGEFIDRSNFLILNIKNNKKSQCKLCKKEIEESFIYCPYCGIETKEKIEEDENNNHEFSKPLLAKSIRTEEKKKNIAKLKEIKNKFPKAYEKWGILEEKKLIKLFKENKKIKEIAQILQRQTGGISSRLKKLGFIK